MARTMLRMAFTHALTVKLIGTDLILQLLPIILMAPTYHHNAYRMSMLPNTAMHALAVDNNRSCWGVAHDEYGSMCVFACRPCSTPKRPALYTR